MTDGILGLLSSKILKIKIVILKGIGTVCNVKFADTYISPGNSVILAGEYATLTCSSSYTPPYWHFYSLIPGSQPCRFDSYSLYPGISLCPAARRISVTYSSSQHNKTFLTIIRAQLSDAGTYTCGGHNPYDLSSTFSVIVGVIGKCTQ